MMLASGMALVARHRRVLSSIGVRRLWAGLAVFGAFLGFAGWASASERPLVLDLKFDQVASQIKFLRSSERYVLLSLKGSAPTHRTEGKQLLINDRTGHRMYLRRAIGCDVQAVADPWVLFGTCPASDGHGTYLPLYNLRTGAWMPLRCPYCNAGSWNSGLVLGSHWLWVYAPNNYYYPLCRCFDGPTFFSVPSGAQNNWQPSSQTAADVNSVGLKRHVCWPGKGVIGPFSSAEEDLTGLVWSNKLTVNSVPTGSRYSETLALQGCSANPNIPLFTWTNSARVLVGANTHLLMWWRSGSPVSGIFIPSLRRFTTRLPVTPAQLSLTAAHIYLLDGNGRVWRAALPSHPAPSSANSAKTYRSR